MGDIVVSKKVLFIGAWRTPTISDQLLRQIAHNIASKKAFPTTLKLSETGLELFIQDKKGNVTRHDQIALENVVEFVDNRYNTKCTLAIVRNRQEKLYTVFGFVCNSDRDAAEMLYSFRTFKKKLGGEGYNVDVTSRGQNWTLVTNENTFVGNGGPKPNDHQQNGDVRIIQNDNRNGNAIYLERTESATRNEPQTKAEMKEELTHLAGEVRDIKRIIQQSKGRHQFEQHYHYTQPATAARTVLHTEPVQRSNGDFKLRRDNQASLGRLQFEKHYNYRILGSPTVKTQTVRSVQQPVIQTDVPDAVIVSPPQTRRQTVYVKRNTQKNGGSKVKHVVAASPPLMVQSLGRSTRVPQRLASTPSVSASTKTGYSQVSRRVYDSANPYQEMRAMSPQNRNYTLVASNRAARFRAQSPVRKTVSYSSDIVQKNIEDVYRNGGRVRMLQRVIVPPPAVSPSVMDYVKVQSNQASSVHSAQNMYDDRNRVEYVEDVVTDEPLQVRGVYENRDDFNEMNTTTVTNVSTAVNTSADDHLDDNVLMQGDDPRYTYTTETETPGIERDGNVIIVRASSDNSYHQEPQVIRQTKSTVVHVRDDVSHDSGYIQQSRSNGDTGDTDVYHVKAEALEDFERHGDTRGMTVISADDREYSRQGDYNEKVTRSVDNPVVHSSVIVMNGDEIHERDRDEHDGLFGAYTRKHNERYDDDTVVVKDKAYRYHDDDEETDNDKVHVVTASRSSETEGKGFSNNGDGDQGRESPKSSSPVVRRVHYGDEDRIIRNGDDSDSEDETTVVITKATSTSVYKKRSSYEPRGFHDELKQRVRDKEVKTDGNGDEDEKPYQLDVAALRKSMEEPDLVIIENDSNKQTNRGASGFSGNFGKVAAIGGTAVTAAVAGGALGGVFGGSGSASNEIPTSSSLIEQAAPVAQNVLETDTVTNFAAESDIGGNVVPVPKDLVAGGDIGDLPSTSDIGDTIGGLADDALDTDAVADFAEESDIGGKVIPVAKDLVSEGMDGDLPSTSGIGDKIGGLADDALDTDAVADFAEESDIGGKVVPVAKDLVSGGIDGNMPSTSDFGEHVRPLADDALNSEAVTSFAADSEFGSKALPVANDVLENGINGDSVTSDIGDKVVPLAKDALETDAVANGVANSDVASDAVPLAKKYLDDEAIRQITSRAENTVLF